MHIVYNTQSDIQLYQPPQTNQFFLMSTERPVGH